LVDRPDRQSREPLTVDLARDAGLVVLGTSGAGCSTAMRTLAAAADDDPNEQWHVHVIDGGGSLGDLVALRSVGDVVAVHDVERVLRLLRTTSGLVDRASAGAPSPAAPRHLILVDGIAAFEERYERIDRGEGTDLLDRIARDGRSAGVHVAVTARRRAEVPLGLMGALSARIVLRCSTEDEAALLGLDDAAAAPDLPPGRCRVGGHTAQLAVVAPIDASADRGPCLDGDPKPVPRIPLRLLATELPPVPVDPWRIAIGLDADSWETATLDLERHHALVGGPPRSGVSSTLSSIAAAHPGTVLLGRDDDVVGACTGALERGAEGHATILAVDDLPDLLDGPDGDRVDAALQLVLRQGRDLPVRLVVGGEIDALGRCFHDALTLLRRGRTGLLLGGDPELHGGIWHASLSNRTDLPPAPGRGWLLSPTSAQRVQVALQ
jgi:S-DNA-T family DNA segregation ATPase FtsK/SpoIIIE